MKKVFMWNINTEMRVFHYFIGDIGGLAGTDGFIGSSLVGESAPDTRIG